MEIKTNVEMKNNINRHHLYFYLAVVLVSETEKKDNDKKVTKMIL
jgi:hypothetical protein